MPTQSLVVSAMIHAFVAGCLRLRPLGPVLDIQQRSRPGQGFRPLQLGQEVPQLGDRFLHLLRVVRTLQFLAQLTQAASPFKETPGQRQLPGQCVRRA